MKEGGYHGTPRRSGERTGRSNHRYPASFPAEWGRGSFHAPRPAPHDPTCGKQGGRAARSPARLSPIGPATPSIHGTTHSRNMEPCHDAIDDPTDCAVAHDAVDHIRRTERAVAGSTLLSAVRRFTLMVDYLFGSFKTMMTLTKTDNRDTVKGDCGWFSLSSCDRSIAHRGTIRCLSRRANAHFLSRVEEHVSTRPKANTVLSPLGRQMRALPGNIRAMSRPRREQASVPMTNSSGRLTRFGRTPGAVLSRPWTLHRITLLVAAVVLMALAGSGARAADPPDAGAFLANLNHRVGEQLAATDIAPEER